MLTIFEKKVLQNANIKNQTKWFYEVLESYCYNKNYCYPGQKSLAEKMGKDGKALNERTIQRYVSELKKCGIIQVKKGGFNPRTGLNETNRYTLAFKNIGKTLNNALKHSKNADTTKKSYKDNKVFIDDINEVTDLIISYTKKEGIEIINRAVEKVKNLLSKGNKIRLDSFELYLQKVIATVKEALQREAAFNKNKKTYIRKSKTSTFNNYEQRPFDESLEAKLLGWEPVEDSSIEEDNSNEFMSSQLVMLRG